MSEELNVVGYLHKNSVGVRILSREATIMARDEGEGWTSTALVPADELSTLRAQNAALVEALENTTQAFQDEIDRRGVTEDLDEEELIDWLGKDDGRKAIGLLIRLRQARNALAQVAK